MTERTKMMEVLTCYKCGIEFGMPHGFIGNRREDQAHFWCPNGHRQAFVESAADQLRRERDRLAQRIAERDDALAFERSLRQQEQRRSAAYRGQVTRLKKRAKAGLCPCCNRHFENLERHMATKHAGMSTDPDLVVIEGGKSA